MNHVSIKLMVLIVVLLFCQNLFSSEIDQHFFNIYAKYRNVPENLMLMKHEHVVNEIKNIHNINSKITVEKVGESIEHRSINLVSFGEGKIKVLLWSQMHGDEPSATAALLAIYKYFAKNFDNPFIKNIYSNLSIHSLIMLNPDGAEKFQRRDALDIDINRDARLLQTPEGRVLKNMQERIKPDFGFNLHNMGGRETVEGTDKILKFALMAPPFDTENNDNPTRIRAKQLAVQIMNTLDIFIKGHVAKYRADYMPRAFGDAMQNWDVSTVLIETGSYTGDESIFLEKLNFVTILSALNAMAEGTLKTIAPKLYDDIPLEGNKVFDILIKNALIINGNQNDPFYGDVGININYYLNDGKIDTVGKIEDIGDLSVFYGKKTINEDYLIITPGFILSKHGGILSALDLLRCGITTEYEMAEQFENKFFSIMDKGNSKLNVEKIPEMTSIPAKKMNFQNKGIIKRNFMADILIFKQNKNSTLELANLKYVIKNGILFEL